MAMKSYTKGLTIFNKCRCLTFLICTTICLFMLISAVEVFAEENPTWKYDFQEVFYDVTYIDNEHAVIVGARGRVLITHDTYKNLWQVGNTGTKELLTSVSFIDDKRGWAAGHGGIVIHTEDGGKNWVIQRESGKYNQPIFDIQFTSPEVGYAVGAYDTLIKTEDGGATWENIAPPLDVIYSGLYFMDDDNGYCIGEFATLIRTYDGGKNWEQIEIAGYEGSFFGMRVLTPEKILIYGITGKMMITKDGGETWKDISLKTPQSMYNAVVNGDEIVLVGGSGTIVVSKDFGESFTEIIDPQLTTFGGVAIHPRGGYLIVGESGRILHFKTSGIK